MPTVAFVESTSLTGSTLKMNYQQSSSYTYQCKTRYDIIVLWCLEWKSLLFLCQKCHLYAQTHTHTQQQSTGGQQPAAPAGGGVTAAAQS